MLDAVLTGDGLAAVADLAADAAGGPVAIVVPRLGVAVASRPAASRRSPACAATSASRAAAAWRRCRAEIVAEVPIASGDERIGGVVLLQPGRPEPEAVEFLHLAAVAALTEVAVEEAREEVEENVRGSFLEELRERPDAIDAGRRGAPRRAGSAAISRARRGGAVRGADRPSGRATWSR